MAFGIFKKKAPGSDTGKPAGDAVVAGPDKGSDANGKSDPGKGGAGKGGNSHGAGGNGGAGSNGSNGAGGPPSPPDNTPGGFQPDQKKAFRWFERGKAVADTGQYDYAIECYIQGLKCDPDNMIQHEALRDVALRRKVGGGKPASPIEKMKSGGKTPTERLLHAEMLWSKEPLSLQLALAVMERAVDVDQAEPDLNLGELANWVGDLVLEKGQTDKPPKKAELLKVMTLYRRIRMYDKAIQACQLALSMDRLNYELIQMLRDLETEATLKKSGFDSTKGKDGEFNVRNMDKQRDQEEGDRLIKTDDMMERQIKSRRDEVAKNPDDVILKVKLAEALKAKETDATQNEAIEIYLAFYKKSNQYNYKEQAGNVKMSQYRRHFRDAQKAKEASPNDAKAAKALQEAERKLQQFELEEYEDRAKNYPTEPVPRFEYAKRLFVAKRYEDAVSAFQMSKIAPALRVKSLYYLGLCYKALGWLDEAIEVLRQGANVYERRDDQVGLDLAYYSMDVLELSARKSRSLDEAKEALKWGSQVLQNKIEHRDIKERMDSLRKLIAELGKDKDKSE